MALRRQIINLVRLDLADNANQAGGVGQVTVMQGNLVHDMVNTGGVGDGSAADNAVNLVALLQQKLRQVGTVLAGDTGNKCFFHMIEPHF